MLFDRLDPIWTLQTGSLFLVVMTPEEFFGSSGGMSFTIKDFDAVGPNEILGHVTVALQDLLKGTGERVEYDVLPINLEPKKKPQDQKRVGQYRVFITCVALLLLDLIPTNDS